MSGEAQYEEIPGEVKRDRYGRPLIIPAQGGKPKPYTRCTTYVGALEDTCNLGQWQQRMAVAGVALRPDLHLRAVSLGAPPIEDGTPEAAGVAKRWKADMNGLVGEAAEAAAASAAATIGTSLHALTEAIDKGAKLNLHAIPDRYRVHLANYQAATARLRVVEVERFVVNDELEVGGTADRFVTIDGHPGLFVADLKTGSVEYGAGKIAMQLATYAHSVKYDPATGARTPLEGIRHDLGVVIHLDAKTGACRLLWADLAPAWEAVRVSGWVRAWRKRKGLLAEAAELYPGTPDAVPAAPDAIAEAAPIAEAAEAAPDAVAPLDGLPEDPVEFRTPDPVAVAIAVAIASAATPDDLALLWREASARGQWTDAHTEAAKARMSQLAADAPASA